jgi:hypothetical protein
LAVLGLPIIEHRSRVFRLVELAHRRIDADLPKQRRHPERPRFIGDNRHDARSKRFILQKVAEEPHDRDRGRGFPALAGECEMRVCLELWNSNRRRISLTLGHITAERLPPLPQVGKL